MAKINKKIMAFVGSNEATELVDRLSEHTDNIYAAVSSEYGESASPGGNITVLSKFMDREKIVSWIDRVGIDMVIDGITMSAADLSEEVEEVCKSKNVEYFKLTERLNLSMNASICRSVDELSRGIEYAVGNVLVRGSIELYENLAEHIISKSERERSLENLLIMLPPNAELLERAFNAGYKTENIISINRKMHADFIIAMFNEFNITHFIISADEKTGIKERLEAVDRSTVRAFIFGDILNDRGMDGERMWNMFAERFGIREY